MICQMQRRFARANPALLSINEDEELATPSSPDGDNGDEESSSSTESNETPTARKRKKTPTNGRKSGRIRDGQDFWAQVDVWFEREIARRDKDLLGPLWKQYVIVFYLYIH